MSRVVNRLKGLYQWAEARIPQVWCDTWYSYSRKTAIENARKNIAGRVSGESKELNILMVVPVVNWETELLDNFSALGESHNCDIQPSGFFESVEAWNRYRQENARKVLDYFGDHYNENKLNIVFLYLSEFHIEIDAIEKLKKKNTIVINFNWDDILHYNRTFKGQSVGLKKIARAVDLNLTMAISPLTRYVKDGAAVFYWNGTATNDRPLPEIPSEPVKKVLFFGSKYGYREELVDYLVGKNVPIEVHGKGWGTDFIEYDDLYRKIAGYSLNLGISTIGYTKNLCCFKGRDLEVPLHGGLYLVNDHPEITSVYQPDVDVLVYRNKKDCYEKIARVLDRPEDFGKIRLSGAKKAATLSWAKRIEYLMSVVSEIVNPYS